MSEKIIFTEAHEFSQKTRFSNAFNRLVSLLFSLLSVFVFIRLFEYLYLINYKEVPKNALKLFFIGLNGDLLAVLITGLISFIPFLLIFLVNKRFTEILFIAIYSLIIIFKVSLLQYYFQALVPLGADFWAYTMDEIMYTINSAGGISVAVIFSFVFCIGLLIGVYRLFKITTYDATFKVLFFLLFPISLLLYSFNKPKSSEYKIEGEYFMVMEKLSYFVDESIDYYYNFQQKGIDDKMPVSEDYYLDNKPLQ